MKRHITDWLLALAFSLGYAWFAAEGLDDQLVIESNAPQPVLTANK
jgi:hypothetical protein